MVVVVAPGTNGVVFTNNDDAYLTALALQKAGVNVRVVDSRQRAEGTLITRAKDAGIEINFGSVISAVEGSHGVTAVKIAAYRKGQGRVITEKKVHCDFIAMSGGWNPALPGSDRRASLPSDRQGPCGTRARCAAQHPQGRRNAGVARAPTEA